MTAAGADRRRLARGVSIYALALIAPRLVRLAAIPIVAHAVTIGAFGSYGLLLLILPFGQIAADLGTGVAALRLAADAADRAAHRALFATLLWSRAGLAAAVALGVGLASGALSSLLTGSAEHAPLVRLLGVGVVAGTVGDALAMELRAEERHGTLAAILFAQSVVGAAVTVAMVALGAGGVSGLVTGRVAGAALGALALAGAARTTVLTPPDAAVARRLFALGAPIGLLAFVGHLRELDRYVLAARGGVDEVGGYELASRVAAPVALANGALTLGLEPHALRAYRDPAEGRPVASFLAIYTFGASVLGLAGALAAPEVLGLFFPDGYRAALVAAPAMLFVVVTDGILRVAGIGGDLAKRTGLWAAAAVTHVAVALPIGWALAPRLGALGTALGVLLGSFAATIVSYGLARRVYAVELPVGRALALVAAGAALAIGLAGTPSGPAPLAVRAAALIAFGAIAYAASGARRVLVTGGAAPSA